MSKIFEDKKCRLCGLADSENENIFRTRDRCLVKKIAAAYSIWITPNDPLPKCICRKCHEKVLAAFKTYKQVKQLQTKWHENVTANDPNNKYIKILKYIQRANISIKNFIETNYGEQLCRDVIENLLISALNDDDESMSGSLLNDENNDTTLMQNGTDQAEALKDNCSNDAAGDDEEENVSLSKIAISKKQKMSPTLVVRCKYCILKFESLKELALHQVSHMKLSIPRIFPAKCLDKNFRRGRLISVQSRQSIRCLNCYLVFDDNKCILEHWSKGQCDFFCQICGEEFSQSPKSLREHITEVHGISYRSLKMQRDLCLFNARSSSTPPLSKPKQKQKHKQSPTKAEIFQASPVEVSSSTATSIRSSLARPIKCRICKRGFRNFKACNSHMRAHKPPYAYSDTEQLSDLKTDAYMEPEPTDSNEIPNLLHESSPESNKTMETAEEAPTSTASIFDKNIIKPLAEIQDTPKIMDMELKTTAANSSAKSQIQDNNNSSNNLSTDQPVVNLPITSPSNPSGKVPTTTTTTAPRGIRMKFVNRRSDLNGSSHNAIKVKSLNDLNTNSNAKTNLTGGQKQPTLFNSKPLENSIAASSSVSIAQKHILFTDVKPLVEFPAQNQTVPTCRAEPVPSTTFISIPNTPVCVVSAAAPHASTPPHHTSVIVNRLSNQPYSSHRPLAAPQTYQKAASSNCTVKDEPMEYI